MTTSTLTIDVDPDTLRGFIPVKTPITPDDIDEIARLVGYGLRNAFEATGRASAAKVIVQLGGSREDFHYE